MSHWKVRDRRTGRCSRGGVDADFDATGRAFTTRVGAKGSLFHFVYGFRVDDDGVRRFHQRRAADTIDDYEVVEYDQAGVEVTVVPGRQMFTRNQLLNKEDRILDDLSPAERAVEDRKQF